MGTADTYVAASGAVRDRIASTYGRTDVSVIPPPLDTAVFTPGPPGRQRGYFLWVGRIVEPYKRLGLTIEAFRGLDLDLVVAGDGRDRWHLEEGAPPNVRFVGWQDDAQRDADLEALKPLAELGVELGNPFTTTGIMPGTNDREFDDQYAFVVERLRPFAEALKASGVGLGIEFISPKTIRNRFTYEFIYSMPQMLQLAADAGTGNIGVLFDLWHHYAAHGTIEELDLLTKDNVFVVHVNDAPAGVEIDEQIDNQRLLPMESGVIPATAMMRKLAEIGFAGPVIAEPFNDQLNALAATDPAAAAKQTQASIAKLFAASGI